MSLWKKVRYFLEAAVLRLLERSVPRWSRLTCVHLANALGEIGYRLDFRGRAVALANVACAFPETTPERRCEIVRASYRIFVRAMLDLFWSPALVTEEGRKYLRIHGWETIRQRAEREKRGILFTSAHAGNWEWSNLALGFLGTGAIAVAEEFANERVAPVIKRLREVSGQQIIPQEKSMLRMMRAVSRGGSAAFMCDLGVSPKQAATVVRVFDLEISASILHAVLVERADALLVAMHSQPQPDGSCDVFVEVIELSAGLSTREIAQRCWDYFEPGLRQNPGAWMWPYKHFRHRPRATEKEYPFYANESGAFEKLRKTTGLKSI